MSGFMRFPAVVAVGFLVAAVVVNLVSGTPYSGNDSLPGTLLFIAGCWAAVAVLLEAIGWRWQRRAAHKSDLLARGVRADAIVRAVKPTGTTGNFGSVVAWLDLEVRP